MKLHGLKMPSTGTALVGATESYWKSAEGQRMMLNPRVSVNMPLESVRHERDVMVYHYHRFVTGAADSHAIAGWCYVMDKRQRAISPTKTATRN